MLSVGNNCEEMGQTIHTDGVKSHAIFRQGPLMGSRHSINGVEIHGTFREIHTNGATFRHGPLMGSRHSINGVEIHATFREIPLMV